MNGGKAMTMWTIDDQYETRPWDALDAVVFDVCNVLLSYSPEEELEAFFPGETELHEKLMEKIIKTPYWNMMDRGTLNRPGKLAAFVGDRKG